MTSTIDAASAWQPRVFPAIPTDMPAEGYVANPMALESTEGDDGEDKEFKAFGDDGLTFGDFIDIINPLQHIPFIGQIYRELTGDEIDPMSRIAGSTLFFGPLGTATAALNVMVEHETGKDLGDHALALFEAETGPTVAENTAEAPTESAAAGVDPVSAWAQGEITWAKQQAMQRHDDPETVPPSPELASSGLDASRFLTHTAPGSRPAMTDQAAVRELAAAPIDANRYLMATDRKQRRERHQQQATLATPEPAAAWGAPKPLRAQPTAPPPAGATAALGGWFSEVMLDARTKYETANRLDAAPAPNRLDVVN